MFLFSFEPNGAGPVCIAQHAYLSMHAARCLFICGLADMNIYNKSPPTRLFYIHINNRYVSLCETIYVCKAL